MNPKPHQGKLFDMTGMRFGRLVVLSRGGSPPGNRYAYWRCRCDCGTEIVTSGHYLRNGKQSCGCLIKEARTLNATHGEARHDSRSPEYRTWDSIRERCANQNSKDYPNYGGRGITICERWQSYENFLVDMGRRPTRGHSIDRIDVNGNYCPENCRWATRSEQQRNRRCNRMLTAFGETRSAVEWAEKYKISYPTLLARLRNGWDVELALLSPVNKALSRGGK